MKLATSKLRNIHIHRRSCSEVKYVITATYEETDEHGNVYIRSITDLPLNLADRPSVRIESSPYLGGCPDMFINLGFGDLMANDKTKTRVECIHEVTKQMTIEEIEKELGYKVKIVSNKED